MTAWPSFICARTASFPSSTACCASTTPRSAARADGQVALAITDLNNLFGAVQFYQACRGQGIKPVIGVDLWMEPEAAATSSPAGCCCWCRTCRVT
jgi:DNA polymerase III alpha subunit